MENDAHCCTGRLWHERWVETLGASRMLFLSRVMVKLPLLLLWCRVWSQGRWRILLEGTLIWPQGKIKPEPSARSATSVARGRLVRLVWLPHSARFRSQRNGIWGRIMRSIMLRFKGIYVWLTPSGAVREHPTEYRQQISCCAVAAS